jgi:hypothetical protein
MLKVRSPAMLEVVTYRSDDMVFGALWFTATAVVKITAAPVVGARNFVSREVSEAQEFFSARAEARRAAAQVSDPLRPIARPFLTPPAWH